jgi:CheY-like chemotaxis protein
MQGDKEKCLQAGMNEYLTKPVDEDALRLMLERFIFEQ